MKLLKSESSIQDLSINSSLIMQTPTTLNAQAKETIESYKRNKRNAGTQHRAFFEVQANSDLFDAMFIDKQGSLLREMLDG